MSCGRKACAALVAGVNIGQHTKHAENANRRRKTKMKKEEYNYKMTGNKKVDKPIAVFALGGVLLVIGVAALFALFVIYTLVSNTISPNPPITPSSFAVSEPCLHSIAYNTCNGQGAQLISVSGTELFFYQSYVCENSEQGYTVSFLKVELAKCGYSLYG